MFYTYKDVSRDQSYCFSLYLILKEGYTARFNNLHNIPSGNKIAFFNNYFN